MASKRNTVRIEIENMAEFRRALDKVGDVAGRRFLRKAALDALEPALTLQKSLTPIGPTGNLMRGNKKQVWTDRAAYVEAEVLNDAPHSHLIEFGTSLRRHESGKSVGSVAPNPFMQTAWSATERVTEQRVANAVNRFIQSHANG